MLAQTSVGIFDQARQDNNFRMSSIDIQNIKCVVIGDGGVGKTSLLITYCCGEFPSDYVPNVFDENVSVPVSIAGESYNLGLWDTGGGEDYHRLRPLCYPNTSVFLVCFSVDRPASFKSVEEALVPEIKHHCPNTPFLILATKVDLRADRATLDKLAKKQEEPVSKDELVSKEEGERIAESVKAAKYLECSALTGEGVKNVFDEAVFHHLEAVKKRGAFKKVKKRCFVL